MVKDAIFRGTDRHGKELQTVVRKLTVADEDNTRITPADSRTDVG